jgi:probable F420-dependent oxidoreductase
MADAPFRIGVVFPQTEIGTDPGVIRAFAQTAEGLGFSHLVFYDHVIGADTKNRPGWTGYTHESMFHEPLTLISYLSGITQKIGFLTGVIILPQRQAVLVAKQAAQADLLSNGRLRLGVGTGWNGVEYEALGVSFEKRGARMEDQIRVLRRLWTERSFSESGVYHRITEAGIYPLPVQRPIPIWIGGNAEFALKRAARLGDGWYPHLAAASAKQTIRSFYDEVKKAGRDPSRVAFENDIIVSSLLDESSTNNAKISSYPAVSLRALEQGVAEAVAWKTAGAGGVSFHTMNLGVPEGKAHIDILYRLAKMVGLVGA